MLAGDIQLPSKIKDAMQMQVEADRKKRAAILESEGQRDAAINRAEGVKQQQILESEGMKIELINNAQGASLLLTFFCTCASDLQSTAYLAVVEIRNVVPNKRPHLRVGD